VLSGGPSASHLLGTDDLGRDILSRVIYGARSSMAAAFLIVFLGLVVALPIGLVSGYLAGRVDAVVMRLMDVLFTFPPLVLALAVTAMLGPSLIHASIALALVFVPSFVRLIRGQVLAVREELYIEASRSSGLSDARILVRHVLPNVASPIVVQAAVSLGYALLAEAGLSFLGLGTQPPTASWGTMLSEAFTFVLNKPWPLIPPGLAIFLAVLAFNLVGDGLRDALGREHFQIAPRA
jgi:peptide/nickel transport system permease protein